MPMRMRMRPHAVRKTAFLRTRAYERLWPDGSFRPAPKGTLVNGSFIIFSRKIAKKWFPSIGVRIVFICMSKV